MRDDVAGCLGCDLATGRRELPGGRVHETANWVIEHCVGPLGVGTLLVKPRRHCLRVGELTSAEAEEMGPLLKQAAACVRELAEADQVYVCLWSHAGWEPGHIHYVVQPAWNRQSESFAYPGPTMQLEMFTANELPDRAGVEEFCDRARAWFDGVEA